MTKRYTSISWLHFNRLLDGGMSSDEAYEKAYGPLPHDEDDESDTHHTITPRDERRYLELKEYARLITAGVGSVEAYALSFTPDTNDEVAAPQIHEDTTHDHT